MKEKNKSTKLEKCIGKKVCIYFKDNTSCRGTLVYGNIRPYKIILDNGDDCVFYKSHVKRVERL